MENCVLYMIHDVLITLIYVNIFLCVLIVVIFNPLLCMCSEIMTSPGCWTTRSALNTMHTERSFSMSSNPTARASQSRRTPRRSMWGELFAPLNFSVLLFLMCVCGCHQVSCFYAGCMWTGGSWGASRLSSWPCRKASTKSFHNTCSRRLMRKSWRYGNTSPLYILPIGVGMCQWEPWLTENWVRPVVASGLKQWGQNQAVFPLSDQ